MKKAENQSYTLNRNGGFTDECNSIFGSLSIEGYQYSHHQMNAINDYLTDKITKNKMEEIIDGTEKQI